MKASSLLLDHFNQPRHVGEFAADESKLRFSSIGSERSGDLIQLQCKVEEDKVLAAKFKAYGSHYTIACCSLAVDTIIGKPIDDALGLSAEQLIEMLVLPKTKHYCAIMVEDVIKACLK